ncbi:MAG: tetratricopeptide repeat protein [Hyphomicrobiales bacterium]|nr:tetratricopeptide repeat protein [Hyphomicrobiales bacterium]
MNETSPTQATPKRSSLARAWALYDSNQLDEAEAAFRAALQEEPGSAAIWDGIGLIAYRRGRHDAAERAFRKALSLGADPAHCKHHLAITLKALGKLDAALVLFEEIAADFDTDAVFQSNRGNALSAAGRPGEGAEVLARAVALRPESDLFRRNLAVALGSDKRPEEAVNVLTSGPDGPDRIELAAELGNAFLAMQEYDKAAAELRRARDAGLANGGDLHNLGTALQFLGQMDEAQEAYRQAIEKGSDSAAASRRQLAGIVKFSGGEQDLEELREALHQKGLSAGDRAEIHIGLAKALDDMGQYTEAFSNLQAGNQLIRMTLDYNADSNSAFIDRSIETFNQGFLADRRDWGDKSRRPVFIVGMPRSGTTLVEQILCSHPEVHGAGELLTISEIFRDLRKLIEPDLGMPRVAENITEELTRKTAQKYLDFINNLDGSAPHVSDKMPFNYRYLGFMSLLFPNTKFIHVERHPLDVGLSCYMARFKEQLNFSFNQTDIGRYYRDYQRIMTHWSQVVSNDLLTINYDTLVAHQERETRRLLAFCDLDWDDRCLAFHQTERPVLTASNWQVRQPLYATSIGRWRNYRSALGPMIASMGLNPDEWQSSAVSAEDALVSN